MLAGQKKVKPLAGLFHRLTPGADAAPNLKSQISDLKSILLGRLIYFAFRGCALTRELAMTNGKSPICNLIWPSVICYWSFAEGVGARVR
jgi:hypothetical protein